MYLQHGFNGEKKNNGKNNKSFTEIHFYQLIIMTRNWEFCVECDE